MKQSKDRLHQLGWCPFFQQQLNEQELEGCVPGRITAVHRSGLNITTQSDELNIALSGKWFELEPELRPTIGDWVLLSADLKVIERLLERKSLFKRMGAGNNPELQLLGANIDTLFLSLGTEASVDTVVVLTKSDLAENTDQYVDETRKLSSVDHVEVVNALDAATLSGIRSWCDAGQTIALIGSSGVGKSTLLNSLSQEELQVTGAVRDSDKHGKHTTSHRSLHLLPGGGMVLDSPGMREFQMADSEAGLSDLFDDIDALAMQCKFSDCAHNSEPGCRVNEGIQSGEIEARRLESYRKLAREQQFANETIAERHKRSREWGKMAKQHLTIKGRE
jgi:ribosome biogenesis GTPase